MSIGFAALAALLLLLPGIGFIAGVNYADKNVREIVFRNTPSEIGYVIIVCVVIHFVFALIPYLHFNPASLYVSYKHLDAQGASIQDGPAIWAFCIALAYFFVTSAVGFGGGIFLGRHVRSGGKWELFAKHRWMLALTRMGEEDTVYARVLLKQDHLKDDKGGEYALILEGILRDSYFAADGTLLYLMFDDFAERKTSLENPPYLGGPFQIEKRERTEQGVDQLVVEGREIAMARYQRVPLDKAAAGVRSIEFGLAALKDWRRRRGN